MFVLRLTAVITALCIVCVLPTNLAPAWANEPRGRVVREQTVEGQLILKGNTRKNRCLITVKNSRHAWTIVADRNVLANALASKDGTPPRSGDYVRITFVRKLLRIEGMDISANFFRSGERINTEPGGILTNIGDVFRGKPLIMAYACQGTLKEDNPTYEDVRRACDKRDAAKSLVLKADGNGYYIGDNSMHRIELTWYQDEFDEGVVNILSEGKLHMYSVYDGRFMEGAAGPDDKLPAALRLE